MNTRPKTRAARPTFPQVGLQEALTAAFRVYSAEPGTHTVDEPEFKRLLGSDLSVSALSRLMSSLKLYDLSDRRRNGYALTDRAVQLFTTEDYVQFKARLDEVAVFSPLMAELSRHYGDQLDSKKLEADLTARQIVGRDRTILVTVLRENERLLGHDLSCRDLFETFRAFRLRAVRPSLGAGVAAARSWLMGQRGRTVVLSTVAVLFAGTLVYFATTRPGGQTVSDNTAQNLAPRNRTPRTVSPPVPEVSLPITAGPVVTADAFGSVPPGWAVTSSAAAGSAITRQTATRRPGSAVPPETDPRVATSAPVSRTPMVSAAAPTVPPVPVATITVPKTTVSTAAESAITGSATPGGATRAPTSSALGSVAPEPARTRTAAQPASIPARITPVPGPLASSFQETSSQTSGVRVPGNPAPGAQNSSGQNSGSETSGTATSATAPAAATFQTEGAQPYFSSALARGRELAGLFYNQRLTTLWSAFSPAVKTEWGGFSGFQAYRLGGLKAFGEEKTLVAEDVRRNRGVSYYTRTATFKLGPEKPWTLIIGLNPQGQVVDFNVVAASVLPQAVLPKTVRPQADAGLNR